MSDDYKTLRLEPDGAALFVTIDAPPINMIGPELIDDLVTLITLLDSGEPYKVVVFKSADPDFFISHVDVTRIAEYREAAARLTGEPSIALLFRRLAETKAVTIAQIEGRARGAGSEFILNCDMRFAARGRAIFAQMEPAFGLVPGGGATQHLVRMMGRGRALEVMFSADDFDADLAERYNWINRAFDPEDLEPFVRALAIRLAGFPAPGFQRVKERVNAISLAPIEEFRRDSDLFGEGVRQPDAQKRVQAAVVRGFQMREPELILGDMLGRISE